jgi:hypothetical protein
VFEFKDVFRLVHCLGSIVVLVKPTCLIILYLNNGPRPGPEDIDLKSFIYAMGSSFSPLTLVNARF